MQDTGTTIAPAREAPAGQGLLDRAFVALVRWDVEKLAWVVLLVIALLSRTIGLGDRAMSHDESLHTYYSWKLFDGQGYQHQPHDARAAEVHPQRLHVLPVRGERLERAHPGGAVRRGDGRAGVDDAAAGWGGWGRSWRRCMYTISPALLYHSRYIRDEVMLTALLVLLVAAMFRYLETRQTKWLVWTAVTLGLAFTTMEASFIFGGLFGIFFWCWPWPASFGSSTGRGGAGARGTSAVALGVALPLLVAGLALRDLQSKRVPGLAVCWALAAWRVAPRLCSWPPVAGAAARVSPSWT